MQTSPLTQETPNYILQVSELTMHIKSALESDFSFVQVEGEISGLTYHNSGHIYFSLKDENATLACTFFRFNASKNPIKLNNGDKIIAKGSINVFPPRGTYSLNITQCVHSGMGDLKAQFEKLKKELELKGYFKKNKKLPLYPKKIIFLTSQTGAALQDMIKVASSRFCLCEFFLIDTLTQGKDAKYSIAKNLAYADRLGADIIVLARGGGSIEDLWSFNEIEVLEAIFACKTPVVSAIGHEIDYLLSDYVADVRAPTPSAAMEMILLDKNAIIMQLVELESTLHDKIATLFAIKRELYNNISQNLLFFHPSKKINMLRQNLQMDIQMLQDSRALFLQSKKERIKQYTEQLEILKPTHKVTQYHILLTDLEKALLQSFLQFLQQKRESLLNLQTQTQTRFSIILLMKRNVLPTNLQESLVNFLHFKKSLLTNTAEILRNSNPAKQLKEGFVQILKDNKPIQIKDLNAKDKVLLVDTSGQAWADITELQTRDNAK